MAEVEIEGVDGLGNAFAYVLEPLCDTECDALQPGRQNRCTRLTGHPEDEPGHPQYNRYPRGMHVATESFLRGNGDITNAWPVKERRQPEGERWL